MRRDDAGEALGGELLVHLHIQRVLSAKQFSIMLVGSEGGCRWSSERVCARAELSDRSIPAPCGQMPWVGQVTG